MNNLLNDKNGKLSSKRIAGFVCIGIGLTMGLAIAFIFIYHNINTGEGLEIESLKYIFTTIITVGGGLLGIGVFEKKQ